MAALKQRVRAFRQAALSILSRLRGKPALLLEDRSSSNVEPMPPGSIDLPPLSPKATPASRDDVHPRAIQALPSETMLPAPVSGAAFEGVTLPLPAVIESNTKSPAPVSRSEQCTKSKNPSLVVYALGHFRVYCDDQLITAWHSKKGKAVFKYLLAQREHQAAKDILMDVFWPDAGPESARNSLNVAIHALRHAFQCIRPGYSFILYEDEYYVINPELQLCVDFEEYIKHYEMGAKFEKDGKVGQALREYEGAESMYQGDLFEEDIYEDWTVLERERLRLAHMDALDHLAAIHFDEEQYEACIEVCLQILSRDNCREDAHRLLMRCHIRREQVALALRQYQTCVEALRHELDVAPMPATTQLFERIRRGERI